jgi:hypothetical protein
MPHLKELVKLYEDKPFALIGVNSGDSPRAFRSGVEKHGVSWLSAYQSDRNEMLNELFQVQFFPTYYVIDADGKIAAAQVYSDELIADLVAKAEKSQQKDD